ncbi:Mitoferrin, variant 2 [Balamuthia mandrillaris]
MGLFRGLPVVAGGAAPVHSISFTVYEFTKRLTNANQTGTHQKLAEGFSGAVATLSHDACMSPIDTVKQRLQFGGRPYRGVVDCVTQLWRTEGLVVFYRGFTTTATMNLPYGTVYYGSYESMKRMIKSGIGHENQRNDPLTHMLAGACGGAMAGAVTTPLDIIRTKLQVGSDAGGVRYSGMVKTTRQIWEAERWRGFVKGLRARVLFHSMSAAISWTTYEYMKFLLETIFLEQQQQQQQQQLRNSTVEAEGSTRRD